MSKFVMVWAAGMAMKAVFFLPTNPHITQVNFERIKKGMTRREVEAILGPPGDYRSGPTVFLYRSASRPGMAVPLEWRGDIGEIWVWVAADGGVRDTSVHPGFRSQSGTMDWLTWRWRRLRNQDAP
jgi:hypothetical protein